jgi:hypothetical protein
MNITFQVIIHLLGPDIKWINCIFSLGGMFDYIL